MAANAALRIALQSGLFLEVTERRSCLLRLHDAEPGRGQRDDALDVWRTLREPLEGVCFAVRLDPSDTTESAL